MRQYEVVCAVMRRQGGWAALGDLYHQVVRHPEWQSESRTPFASIRRIVQDARFFFKIRPGLWALNEARARLSAQFPVSPDAPAEQRRVFDHTYYQGLLVKLGGLCGYETCVPNQDRNRRFIDTPLGELATLPDYPAFTYPEVMRRAKMVDVGWFNARGFPHAFYEVEHSTDIQNSLLKFFELQDFRTKFVIVADAARRKQFHDELARSAFAPIQPLVSFLDYEALAQAYDQKASANTQQWLDDFRP